MSWTRSERIRPSAGLLCAVLCGIAASGEPGTLRVGTSADYPPFSRADEDAPDGYAGLEIDLARAYAADRGLDIEWVRFRWPRLLADLAADHFDVAMSGVTVRADRAAAGRYTIATLETGAVALVADPRRYGKVHDLNRSRVRIGVNAGGHLEAVARRTFPRATLIAIPANDRVREALVSGAVDAIVTETHEAALWRAESEGAGEIGPFTRDRKAWLVRPERDTLAADLDAWLLEKEADGTLLRLRSEHLASPGPATAEPLRALLAAVDERLSLMPLVGVVKRRSGVPLEVPEREAAVLDAASTAVLEAASRSELRPPSVLDIRNFFRVQMEAAKRVQLSAVQDASFEPGEPLPDLVDGLRPGLLRVGERIARLIVALPGGLAADIVRAEADEELRAPYLSNRDRRALADAIAKLSR